MRLEGSDVLVSTSDDFETMVEHLKARLAGFFHQLVSLTLWLPLLTFIRSGPVVSFYQSRLEGKHRILCSWSM